MPLTKAGLRFALFILSFVSALAAGIYFLGAGSILDIVHFLSVPLIVSWLIIYRPQTARKNIVPYFALVIITALLAAAFLIAFTRYIPYIKINWLELPIAVYFLLSIYVIIWLLDKSVNRILSFILRIKNAIIKKSLIGLVRAAFMLFVIVPYLIAVFTTHWIKFAGADETKYLTGMKYQRLSFNGTDGTKLDGLFVPAATGISDSAVIIAAGRSPSKNFYLSYAGILSNSGYNVLLFDSRGNGDSSGHKYSFTVNEANDIICAIDYLKSRYAPFSSYIFGLGINEGAAALITAAGTDYRLTAAVFDNASGYQPSLPEGLDCFLPGWLDKTLSKIMTAIITLDIGRGDWGTEKIYNDISLISPCPVLFTSGLKNDKSGRMRTIELYAKAKDPKMLWMSPAGEDQNFGVEMEYFKNILNVFDYAKAQRRGIY